MKHNLLMMCDRYAYGHYLQMPPGVEYSQSYIEARGGLYDEVVFFGLQAYIRQYLNPGISEADVDEAQNFAERDGQPFNREGFMRIVKEFDGVLPLKIKSAPEGSVIPTGNILVSIENTEPGFAWLPSFIEASILRAVWYPTAVATKSFNLRLLLEKYAKETADNSDFVPYQLHDFGARGVSSEESARIGGAAHLLSFRGSDTVTAERFLNEYYVLFGDDQISTGIPAAQHSTVTAWGKEAEKEAYEFLLEEFTGKYSKAVSVVVDSYDQDYAIEVLWGTLLKDKVEASGGTVVIRTDSGDPTQAPIDAVKMLADKFGYTENSKGYKVLPDCVRVIHSDGMSPETIEKLMDNLVEAGFSSENVFLGMGGELLQAVGRDDTSMAMKTSYVQFEDGDYCYTYKDPVTAPGKRSKSGVLTLVDRDGQYETVDVLASDALLQGAKEVLRLYYIDGVQVHGPLRQIRDRVEVAIKKGLQD